MASGGKDYKLKATLSLTDRFSVPLKTAQARLMAFGNRVNELGEAGANIGRMLAAPMALLGGAGALSLSGIVNQYTEVADAIDKAATRAGVGVEALQKLDFAAEQSGMTSDDMAKALQKLTAEMGKAASGQNQNLAGLFRHLGISLRGVNGDIRSAGEVMRHLAEAVKNNENPAARMQIVTAAFGEVLGAKLIPLLSGGADGLDEFAAKAERLGLVMDKDTIEKANELGDGMDELKKVFGTVSTAIGAQLQPVLMKMIEPMEQIIARNRDLIASKVGEFATAFGKALENIDWDRTITGFFDVVSGIGDFIESIGGAKTLLIAFSGMLAGDLFVKLVTFGKALYEVGRALFFISKSPIVLIIYAIIWALWHFRDVVIPVFKAFVGWIKTGVEWLDKLLGRTNENIAHMNKLQKTREEFDTGGYGTDDTLGMSDEAAPKIRTSNGGDPIPLPKSMEGRQKVSLEMLLRLENGKGTENDKIVVENAKAKGAEKVQLVSDYQLAHDSGFGTD